jgi:hypothetical protein
MSRNKALITLVLCLAACSGSTPELQAVSAQDTGCPANEISISNSNVGITTADWTAACRGKTYACSGDDMLHHTTCSPVVR